MDGPGNKIGRKNGGVPAGYYAKGKIPGDHTVDRNNKGGGKTGKQKIGPGVVDPLTGFTGPSKGEHLKNLFAHAMGPVPDDGQIRKKPGIPEKTAHGEIGGDGNNIKHQGRLKVGP